MSTVPTGGRSVPATAVRRRYAGPRFGGGRHEPVRIQCRRGRHEACSGDGCRIPDNAVPASAGSKDTERPFRGSCDTAITPLSGPGEIPIVLAVDVVCRLSHLGLTVGGTDREVVVPAGPPSAAGILPIYITVERITYVAANGDELWSTFAGPANSTSLPEGQPSRRRDLRRRHGPLRRGLGPVTHGGRRIARHEHRPPRDVRDAALLTRPRAPEPNDMTPRGRGSSSAGPTSRRRAHHHGVRPVALDSQPRAAICSRTVRSTM